LLIFRFGSLAKKDPRYGVKGMVADPEVYDMHELAQMKKLPHLLATYSKGVNAQK
jgi:hypothetical protein